MDKTIADSSELATRVQNLFATIFFYHFSRKPVFSERHTPFGNYASMKFRGAVKSPLALLLKEEGIAESNFGPARRHGQTRRSAAPDAHQKAFFSD